MNSTRRWASRALRCRLTPFPRTAACLSFIDELIEKGYVSGRPAIGIDGETLPIQAGDSFRIDPAGKRAIRAAADSSLNYICIQTKAHSLGGFTMTDAKLVDDKAPWMK